MSLCISSIRTGILFVSLLKFRLGFLVALFAWNVFCWFWGNWKKRKNACNHIYDKTPSVSFTLEMWPIHFVKRTGKEGLDTEVQLHGPYWIPPCYPLYSDLSNSNDHWNIINLLSLFSLPFILFFFSAQRWDSMTSVFVCEQCCWWH